MASNSALAKRLFGRTKKYPNNEINQSQLKPFSISPNAKTQQTSKQDKFKLQTKKTIYHDNILNRNINNILLRTKQMNNLMICDHQAAFSGLLSDLSVLFFLVTASLAPESSAISESSWFHLSERLYRYLLSFGRFWFYGVFLSYFYTSLLLENLDPLGFGG